MEFRNFCYISSSENILMFREPSGRITFPNTEFKSNDVENRVAAIKSNLGIDIKDYGSLGNLDAKWLARDSLCKKIEEETGLALIPKNLKFKAMVYFNNPSPFHGNFFSDSQFGELNNKNYLWMPEKDIQSSYRVSEGNKYLLKYLKNSDCFSGVITTDKFGNLDEDETFFIPR